MYIGEIFNQWRARRRVGGPGAKGALPPTVYALGATSMLTDVSTEMVASVLPVYLLVALRLSPAEYGLVDGLFRGGAAIVALLLGGLLTYGSGRTKFVAGIGYAMSMMTKVLLLASSAFFAIAASLVLDRFGKGLRVVPRDAMLAASVPRAQLGMAFGVHRAMDGLGAVSGPLLAAFVLWQIPNGYTALFALSLVVSVAGLLVFIWFVRHPAGAPDAADEQVPVPVPRTPLAWRSHLLHALPPRCRRLLFLAMPLALFTVSEGMMFAHMQRSFDLAPHLQPLLPVATATVFLLLAVPLGWVADRFGAGRVFCTAHLLLLPLYVLLVAAGGEGASLWLVGALVLLSGGFLAATDGVLMAAVSGAVAPASRALSIALCAAALALMRLLSSAGFGILWDRVDIGWAVAIFGAGLSCSLLACWYLKPFEGLAPPETAPVAPQSLA
ncbi:MAG: MFS transporter [Pseudomonadota bacterium]